VLAGNVSRRFDEAANTTGWKPVEQRLQLTQRTLELEVARRRQRLGAAGELQQPASGAGGSGLRVGARGLKSRATVSVVALIEDGAAADLVHLVVVGLIHGGAAAQRSGGPAQDSTTHNAERQRDRSARDGRRWPPSSADKHSRAQGQDVVEEGAVTPC